MRQLSKLEEFWQGEFWQGEFHSWAQGIKALPASGSEWYCLITHRATKRGGKCTGAWDRAGDVLLTLYILEKGWQAKKRSPAVLHTKAQQHVWLRLVTYCIVSWKRLRSKSKVITSFSHLLGVGDWPAQGGGFGISLSGPDHLLSAISEYWSIRWTSSDNQNINLH